MSPGIDANCADRGFWLGAVSAATGVIGWPVPGARLLDATVDALVVVDEGEHARRQHTGPSYLRDRDLINVFMGLPQGEPISWGSLSERERRLLQRAPEGSLETSAELVTRHIAPPVQSVFAMVRHDDWDAGLDVASRFAPVATRLLLLPAKPTELPQAIMDATEYGIGLAIEDGASVDVVVPPKLWQPHYFSAGGWLFREQAYGAWLAQHTRAPALSRATARG